MSNRPTIKTIAEQAGVSHVTVSKALRDEPDISVATKEKIKGIAHELGYTPNKAARNLYLKRSGAIGVVVPAMGGDTAYDIVFNEISALAAERDYCVMLGSSHRSIQLEERHCRMMAENQVGILIVASCTSETAHIKAACGSVPVIFIGGKTCQEEQNNIFCDYYNSGALAVKHLAKQGHKDIALLTYEPGNNTILQKEAGFSAAMEDKGLTPRILRVGEASDTMSAGKKAVELLLEQGKLPTALCCASDYMALGVKVALKLHGLSVPKDVSVMGHDDLDFSSYPDVDLTTIRTPMRQLGQAAAELAIALMEHNDSIPSRQVFQPTLVVRGSTGAARR
ncbi:MAG: LacI family transcriptional regulator [Roseburia sp.]|nr:LacI family transcriptional regulator [Roseburia sp.]MCM1098780.1 LacI family transcriptional regulator [Ruminococcus flavefaciens]MCM1235987.1 LacI family transcriptional regulator [Ruminococcus flavefaciens]